MSLSKLKALFLILIPCVLIFGGCQNQPGGNSGDMPTSGLGAISATKLGFRFETDVPPPPEIERQKLTEEKNPAVQADFDQNRTTEILEKTFTSPNKQRVIAVYRKPEDSAVDFRLDMYAADGKLIRKITPNGLAVQFPDTLVWAPDGASVAFVGKIRLVGIAPAVLPTPGLPESPTAADSNSNSNSAIDANTSINAEPVITPTATAEPQSNVLTLRTEQIYLCDSEGGELKALTQNEGLIYFYFIWSPDGQKLAALAATWKEWQFGQAQAELKGESFIPVGRPRLVEKTGRERRLDDNFTNVQPVWSPDSAKLATAFGTDVRIYDAAGETPTQAAIPLRNQLLIASKKFDEDYEEKDKLQAEANQNSVSNNNPNSNTNGVTNINAAPTPVVPQDVSTLPAEDSLVSFNPITQLEWTEDTVLYLQTGYIKEMKNQADSARSFLRWHRLILSLSPSK